MDEPPNKPKQPGALTSPYRPRRWAAMCGAAIAAALFTPVPAMAETIAQAHAGAEAAIRTTNAGSLAQALISTGMIGLGLAMGGLAIVARRRQRL